MLASEAKEIVKLLLSLGKLSDGVGVLDIICYSTQWYAEKYKVDPEFYSKSLASLRKKCANYKKSKRKHNEQYKEVK